MKRNTTFRVCWRVVITKLAENITAPYPIQASASDYFINYVVYVNMLNLEKMVLLDRHAITADRVI